MDNCYGFNSGFHQWWPLIGLKDQSINQKFEPIRVLILNRSRLMYQRQNLSARGSDIQFQTFIALFSHEQLPQTVIV